MTSQQIQKIYGMAAALGMVDSSIETDDLHLLIESRTGKTSVKDLNDKEYQTVVGELAGMLQLQNIDPPKPRKHYDETVGKMTEAQQRKVWRLMYQLREQDMERNASTLGSRLCGIIKTTFGMDTVEKEPLKWLTREQGGQLIETIKRYISSAKRKKDRGG